MAKKEDLQSEIAKLEKIVEELGTKELDVEKGLAKFKEGVEIIKKARTQLAKAENEFTKLRAELADGEEEATEASDESGF